MLEEVYRLLVLVARLQHAINQLQEPEAAPEAIPVILEPLADLRNLFPDIAHRLCLAASHAGPASMPSFCSDAL